MEDILSNEVQNDSVINAKSTFPLYEVFKYNGNSFVIAEYKDAIMIRFRYHLTSKVSVEEFKSKNYIVKIIKLILVKYPQIKDKTDKIYVFYNMQGDLTYIPCKLESSLSNYIKEE